MADARQVGNFAPVLGRLVVRLPRVRLGTRGEWLDVASVASPRGIAVTCLAIVPTPRVATTVIVGVGRVFPLRQISVAVARCDGPPTRPGVHETCSVGTVIGTDGGASQPAAGVENGDGSNPQQVLIQERAAHHRRLIRWWIRNSPPPGRRCRQRRGEREESKGMERTTPQESCWNYEEHAS